AKLCRCAVPSVFAPAVRAARDAFQTRHGLSPRPCGSPGEVAHLSTVFDAEKTEETEKTNIRVLAAETSSYRSQV
ncbi:hypothetical protein, partial [Dickeya chrysanthemi]|uniref:hypothetical protein n=1 Tax=Dickeya chrysanthemi TaxID=556 RepID=UPI0012684C99